MSKGKMRFAVIAALAVLALTQAASAYYSPAMGRFLSRDPIGEPGAVMVRQTGRPATGFLPRDPLDKNGYTGMQNNAISWFDPDGGQATTVPVPPPAAIPGMDTVEVWCSSYQAGPITTSYDHCDVRCTRADGTVLVGGGRGSKPSLIFDGGGRGGNGYPDWMTKPDLPWGAAGLTLAASAVAPSGTCNCISSKGGKLNMIKGKHYDVPGMDMNNNVSNSNAVLSTLLTCCNVGIMPALPPGRSAPGWGDKVEYECGCETAMGPDGLGYTGYIKKKYCLLGCDDINASPKQPSGK